MARRGRAAGVTGRLLLFAVLMLALTLVVAALALAGSERSSLTSRHIGSVAAPAAEANRDLRAAVQSGDSSVRAALQLVGDGVSAPAQRSLILEPYEEAVTVARQRVGTLDALIPAYDEADRSRLQPLHERQRRSLAAWIDWSQPVARSVGGPAGQGGDEPGASGRTDPQAGQAQLRALLDDNVEVQAALDASLAELGRRSRQSVRSTMWAVTGSTAFAVGAGSVLTWWASRHLARPLRQLRDTVRRQRLGERDAWADESSGAAEVRDLAADVNELTRTQRRLAEAQAQNLALLRAVTAIVREIEDAGSIEAAVQIAAAEVGRTLSADFVTAMLVEREGGRYDAVWSRELGLTTELGSLPEEGWEGLQLLADRLWHGERRMAIDDLAGSGRRLPPWSAGMTHFEQTRALLVLPIGVGREASGIMSVHLRAKQGRTWDESEIAFVERVLRELARWAERGARPAAGD